ncbi:MAG: hypothetical protein AAGA85_06600 [Bacteroidota bacterium]
MVKKLTIVSIVLIVINITLLGLIFLRRGGEGPIRQRGPRESFDRRLAHRLDLSAEQKQLYRAQTMAHQQRHQELSLALLEVKKGIHQALGTSDKEQLAGLLPKMDSIHALREREVIGFAESILDICEEDQREEFLRLLASSIEGRQGFHRRRRDSRR